MKNFTLKSLLIILLLSGCNPETYKDREQLEAFIIKLCETIGVKRGDLCWWDYAGYPTEYREAPSHLKGTSVVQFIMTSTIVIHALDELKTVYLNVFSCDDFDGEVVKELAEEWFEGSIKQCYVLDRK